MRTASEKKTEGRRKTEGEPEDSGRRKAETWDWTLAGRNGQRRCRKTSAGKEQRGKRMKERQGDNESTEGDNGAAE